MISARCDLGAFNQLQDMDSTFNSPIAISYDNNGFQYKIYKKFFLNALPSDCDSKSNVSHPTGVTWNTLENGLPKCDDFSKDASIDHEYSKKWADVDERIPLLKPEVPFSVHDGVRGFVSCETAQKPVKIEKIAVKRKKRRRRKSIFCVHEDRIGCGKGAFDSPRLKVNSSAELTSEKFTSELNEIPSSIRHNPEHRLKFEMGDFGDLMSSLEPTGRSLKKDSHQLEELDMVSAEISSLQPNCRVSAACWKHDGNASEVDRVSVDRDDLLSCYDSRARGGDELIGPVTEGDGVHSDFTRERIISDRFDSSNFVADKETDFDACAESPVTDGRYMVDWRDGIVVNQRQRDELGRWCCEVRDSTRDTHEPTPSRHDSAVDTYSSTRSMLDSTTKVRFSAQEMSVATLESRVVAKDMRFFSTYADVRDPIKDMHDLTKNENKSTQDSRDLTKNLNNLTQDSRDLNKNENISTQDSWDLSKNENNLTQDSWDRNKNENNSTPDFRELNKNGNNLTQDSRDLDTNENYLTQDSWDLNKNENSTPDSREQIPGNKNENNSTQDSWGLTKNLHDLMKQDMHYSSQQLHCSTQNEHVFSRDLRDSAQDIENLTRDAQDTKQYLRDSTKEAQDTTQHVNGSTQKVQAQDTTQDAQGATKHLHDPIQKAQDTRQNLHDSTQGLQTLTSVNRTLPLTTAHRTLPTAYRCTHCGYTGRRLFSVKRHVRTHLPDGNDDALDSSASQHIVAVLDDEADRLISKLADGTYACSFCTYRSPKVSNIRRHISTHRLQLPSSISHDAPVIAHLSLQSQPAAHVDVYSCSDCAYATRHLYNFRRHIHRHSPDTKLKCRACPRVYSDLYKLRQHQGSAHEMLDSSQLTSRDGVCNRSFAASAETQNTSRAAINPCESAATSRDPLSSPHSLAESPTTESTVPSQIVSIKQEHLASSMAEVEGTFSAVDCKVHDVSKYANGETIASEFCNHGVFPPLDCSPELSNETSVFCDDSGDNYKPRIVSDCTLPADNCFPGKSICTPKREMTSVYDLVADGGNQHDASFDLTSPVVKWNNELFSLPDWYFQEGYCGSDTKGPIGEMNDREGQGINREGFAGHGVSAAISGTMKQLNPLRKYCSCGKSFRWRSSLAWHRKICKYRSS